MSLHTSTNAIPPCNFIEQIDYEYVEDDDPESTSGKKVVFTGCSYGTFQVTRYETSFPDVVGYIDQSLIDVFATKFLVQKLMYLNFSSRSSNPFFPNCSFFSE